jgi:hypothetical protein
LIRISHFMNLIFIRVSQPCAENANDLRAVPAAARLLTGPFLLNSSKGICRWRKRHCRCRGTEVATPPLKLQCTALVTQCREECLLSVFVEIARWIIRG